MVPSGYIISCSSPSPPTPSPTLYNVETWNKFWIQVCIVVCGVEEGFGMCDLKNAPKLQICPTTFIHDCSKHKFYHALFILYLWKSVTCLPVILDTQPNSATKWPSSLTWWTWWFSATMKIDTVLKMYKSDTESTEHFSIKGYCQDCNYLD